VAYWSVARLALKQERLALHCLGLAGFETYLPRLRERRIVRGRRVERRPPLFPGYAFIVIELQWHAARWAPGTLGLIMYGSAPAHVPDAVIAELRSRERGGLVELVKPPRLRRGDQVRIVRGAFSGCLGLYDGQTARERVAVLLELLGGQRRTELPADAVEPIAGAS
jgi:transcriptional antiterminator RfaH